MDRAPELADPTRSLAAGQARGKKRRREETAGKGGTSSDPAVDPSLAGLRTGPDGAQADTEGASLKQGAPAQSVKKRKKHPTHRQLASDVSPRQDQAQTEQQDCQSPRAPDSTHRKRKKKKKAHNAEAVAQGTETAVGNESDRHQLWATSVSNASNMKHGSRLPNSRNVEAPSEAAERIDISKDLRKSSHAAAPAAAAAALHVDEAVPQPQVACDVEPPQSAAEQFPDAAIEAQDLDQDLADAAEQPSQPTAKQKPGRPKGSGRKALLQPAAAVRKKLGRPKGLKNKPKDEAERQNSSGKTVKVTQLAKSKPKSSIPHPTFHGVWKTPPATRKIPPGVDCVWTAQLLLPEQKGKVILGRSYWTAEAAARAVDRAQLAVHGRDKAVLNFPSEWYGPEEIQRRGADLDKWLTRLSGWECNNPLNAPGVPHIPWVHARTRLRLQPGWEKKKKGMPEPELQPQLGIRVREHFTGVPASSEGIFEPARHNGAAWYNKPCNRCTACRLSTFQKPKETAKVSGNQCTVVVKMRAARAELLRQAKASGQPRFEPADLPAFLASLGSASDSPGALQQQLAGQDIADRTVLTDPAGVKLEKRGGPRRKKSAYEVVKTCIKDSRAQTKAGKANQPSRSKKQAVWPQSRLIALQAREEALHAAQEQARVLAADTAPNRGVYQPLLAPATAAPGIEASQRWPDNAAIDLRHIARQAEKAELVEVHDHTRWAAPQIGLFGPPADPPLGPQAPAARQGSRQGHCLWCKATDHVIGQCPLNEYASEHFPPAPKQKAAAKQQGLTAMQPATSAAATRLDSVPDGVKEVMLAMQQMASVAVQMNAARDPCHNDLLQSLSPDALLACGLLVNEVVSARTNNNHHD